jgi:hypothetical protein
MSAALAYPDDDFPADEANGDVHLLHVGGEQGENGSTATKVSLAPIVRSSLADPFLALAADILDDLEHTRIANENRLRQLTRSEADADGEERGFGLDESHPDVARLAAMVEALARLEHDATLNLQRLMRKHPLGPWCKAQRGIGEKQAARLLAAIGDPYWHSLEDRPRTVSELWAYCGYHTLPASHWRLGIQSTSAGGSDSAGSDQGMPCAQTASVAARRQRGQRANWSAIAKTRAYLIAERCMVAGGWYREVYDKRKAATEGRLHVAPCVRCGPSGHPAQPASSWSAGHRHADALRITAKAILRDLWREAKRIHEEET